MSARIQSSERVRVSASRRLSSDPCWVTPWHLPDELARAGQRPWAGVPGPRSPRHRLAGQLPFQQCSPDPPGYRLLSCPSGAPASSDCTPSTSRTSAAGAEPAAHGSIDVLSELAAVPPGDATVEQRPERTGHALRALLEGGPHPLRGPEERRVARVEEVRIERRAPELALFLERFAQVVRERLDVDRRDARFPLEHGHLLHVRLCGVLRPVKSRSPRAASGPV